jgi:nitroreductase
MSLKHANTASPIHDLLATRWSGRAFDTSRLLTREQVIALLEAARWSPSCYGDQPWRFVVADKASDSAGWQVALDCLVPFNAGWAQHAPLLVVICADLKFGHNGAENRWATYDTGAAALALCLQANAMGMSTHQMGGFDDGKTRAAFGIPAEVPIMAIIAVGYLGSDAVLDDELRQREHAARARKGLGETFYAGQWGKAWGG